MSQHPHVLIVQAAFYPEIAAELIKGATAALDAAGASHDVVSVPGAFEIPAAIARANDWDGTMLYHAAEEQIEPAARPYDGFIALGCVIRGETSHYDYVCWESARKLMDLSVEESLAIGYGILTVENENQAWERARVDRKNKGRDAAEACLAMIEYNRAQAERVGLAGAGGEA